MKRIRHTSGKEEEANVDGEKENEKSQEIWVTSPELAKQVDFFSFFWVV